MNHKILQGAPPGPIRPGVYTRVGREYF